MAAAGHTIGDTICFPMVSYVVSLKMDNFHSSDNQSRKTLEFPARFRSGLAPLAEARRNLYDGLCIVGCEPECGKTVLMCGLAGVLCDQGAKVRAIKPVTYARQSRSSTEYSFISCITRKPIDYTPVHLSFPPLLGELRWEQIIADTISGDDFTFVELPCGVSTPLFLERESTGSLSHEWRTSADLIHDLQFPALLVARHAPDVFEKLSLALSYLKMRSAQVLAVATVEANPLEAHCLDQHIPRDDFQLFITTNFKLPYLGCLRFSPSISVSQVSQGNLKRTTEECMDLLILRRSLNLPVCPPDDREPA